MVTGLALAPLFDPDFLWLSGTVCAVSAVISIIWGFSFNKKEAIAIVGKFDWDTTLFLAGIFVLVSTFDESGLIIDMKNIFMNYLGTAIGSEYLLVFGLLIGTCMGGNITPIGATANIVSVGILKKEGYPVSFWTFAKIGLPFTIVATLSGALFIWLVWK
jgi:Na+/H+ antiporter NhaD/arsenite permease-like protein